VSVKIMSDVFEKSKTEGNTRLVFLCLADCANDEGACWPSIRKISQKANLSEPMTKKHINALIAIGVVNRDEREDHSGRQTSNFYTVDVAKIGYDEIGRDVWEQVTPISRQHKFGGVTEVTGGGGNSSQGVEGVTLVSLSYMNHHKEPSKEPSSDSAIAPSKSSIENNDELFTMKVAESPSAPTKRKPQKSNLIDDAFLSKLKLIYADKDVDLEYKKAQGWIAARPQRKLTRQFFSNWMSKADSVTEEWKPTTI
jgi:hypothetical protein